MERRMSEPTRTAVRDRSALLAQLREIRLSIEENRLILQALVKSKRRAIETKPEKVERATPKALRPVRRPDGTWGWPSS
jgi:hypothetical protein